MENNNEKLFQNVSELLEKARKNVRTAVNLSMVYTYFEIGRLIFEEEQNGEQRASYGKYLMNELSAYLTVQFGKGFSVTNLKQMRQFYVVYSRDQISQADAAKAIVDVFAGQPYLTSTYRMDNGVSGGQMTIAEYSGDTFAGWCNQRIIPELSDATILEHLNKIQRSNSNQIEPSSKLEGRCNLTIEMETGVGKTYTYIKTMYELNKHYGWSKFIIVVPSIAIREGVYKSFQTSQEHFAEEYGKKTRFFIYNSSQLTEIDRFASDSAVFSHS